MFEHSCGNCAKDWVDNVRAHICPYCGSSHITNWSTERDYERLAARDAYEVPDDEYDEEIEA